MDYILFFLWAPPVSQQVFLGHRKYLRHDQEISVHFDLKIKDCRVNESKLCFNMSPMIAG